MPKLCEICGSVEDDANNDQQSGYEMLHVCDQCIEDRQIEQDAHE